MCLVFSDQVMILNDTFYFLIKVLIMCIPILLLLMFGIGTERKTVLDHKRVKQWTCF